MDSEQTSPEQTKGQHLDLKVSFKRGGSDAKEIVDVEVQTTNQEGFSNRLLAYAARAYSKQLKRGKKYTELSPVYSLLFTTENMPEFKGVCEYYHHSAIQRVKPPHSIFSTGMQFVVVELKKFTKKPG